MKSLMNASVAAATALLGLVLAPAAANAYLPPSQYIVKRVAERKSGIKTVKISSTVVAMDGGKPTSVHFKEVTEFDFLTGSLRSTAYDDDSNELYRVVRALGPAVAPEPEPEEGTEDSDTETTSSLGTAASETQDVAINVSSIPPANFLLLDGNYHAVTLAMLRWGIPVKVEEELMALETEAERRAAEVTSIRRWDERVAWVIGPSNGAQLWVEKDSFLPIRMLWQPERQASTELAFRNYRFFKSLPYPGEISLISDSKALLRSELTQIQIDVPLTDMSVAATAGAHGATSGPAVDPALTGQQSGFTEAGNGADPAVKNLINQYYSLIR